MRGRSGAGYHCAGIGKFHFTPPLTHHGFHELELMEEIPRWVDDDRYLQFLRANGHGRLRNLHGIRNLLYWQPQRSLVPEEHHGTTWVGDRAVRFLRDNARRPFFLQLGFIAPHPPLNVPDRWAELAKGAPLPPAAARRPDPPQALRDLIESYDDPRPEKVARTRELYHAAVWHVDHQVGRVLAELDALGLAENTLVIAASDHGDSLGDLGAWSKSVPYEGACHIPMIVRFPRRLKPGVRDDFADLNDILPTCMDAAGVVAPAGAPGESLLLAAGAGKKDRSVQYVEHRTDWRRWVMLRDARWKLVHWYDGREELFDLEADPGEGVDLVARGLSGDAVAVHRRLRERLLQMEARWGLEGCVVDGDFAKPPIVPSDWLPGTKPLEWQFQFFWWGLTEAERRAMRSEREEVLAATAREPLTDLSRLDLGFYLSAGGDPDLVAEVERAAGRR
jgi:arylsulfatase A-like enzyme